MKQAIRWMSLVAVLGLSTGADLLGCGDKFLVAGRGTRYQRPKNARAASVLIYADPSSGLAAALQKVSLETVLKREGHRSTMVGTLDQLSAILAGGRFDVVLAADSVAPAIEERIGSSPDAPVLVAFCTKTSGKEHDAGKRTACSLKAPAKEGALLEAIDKAVERHDGKNRKLQARG
jgi:DNA-binding NtrC family response regulator